MTFASDQAHAAWEKRLLEDASAGAHAVLAKVSTRMANAILRRDLRELQRLTEEMREVAEDPDVRLEKCPGCGELTDEVIGGCCYTCYGRRVAAENE